MAAGKTLAVSITPGQALLVRACLQSSRCASAGEVVRAPLRLLDRDEGIQDARRRERLRDGAAARV